ncbi:glycosyltransferase family 4 protein [Actinomadura alba]|uniref:glycosyltransferase family 4 protein n=1 Tax=Actinomadura alba TaxID=406431 RepID=UPI0028AB206F|nr:glycosyltransferase family 4 protein [Actinomadura alba]
MSGVDDGPLRVALLSYRSKPHCGGQGVYLRHLSRELAALGHHVEVLSGQPYPELDDERITLTKLPSLDLYNDDDPFRTPGLKEYRDWIDVLEVAHMRTGGFPEPLTFSLRALRELRGRRADFDVVHDNQVLGFGNLRIPGLGLPLVTSIHHPISVDRRIEIEAAKGIKQNFGKRRWYGFVRMQARVSRRIGRILTVSESSKVDIVKDFGADPGDIHILPLGVDTRVFHPREAPRVPGRIVAVASADSPIKGVSTLLRAVAKLATERDVHVVVVSKPTKDGPTDRLVRELSLGERVRFVSGISDDELGELLAGAEIGVVPSLYEGFSLPAVEHMASGTPLVASRTGALPEVVGDAGVLVEPGDVEELASVLRRLHDSAAERARVAEAGLQRVQERFAWPAVAAATVEHYRSAIATGPR